MKRNHWTRRDLLGWALHLAGLLMVAAALFAFYSLGCTRLSAQSKNHATRIEQLGKLLETSADVHRQHQSLRQELSELEQAIDTLRERLPHELSQEIFESDTRRVAKQVDLDVEGITWRTSHTTATHSQADVVVRGFGSFASICRFLHEASQFTRLTKISELSIETDSNSERFPLQATFVLVYGVESHDTDRKGGIP